MDWEKDDLDELRKEILLLPSGKERKELGQPSLGETSTTIDNVVQKVAQRLVSINLGFN